MSIINSDVKRYLLLPNSSQVLPKMGHRSSEAIPQRERAVSDMTTE